MGRKPSFTSSRQAFSDANSALIASGELWVQAVSRSIGIEHCQADITQRFYTNQTGSGLSDLQRPDICDSIGV